MRLYITICCLLWAFMGFSQGIQEIPLRYNPILKAQTQQTTEQLEAILKKVNTPPIEENKARKGPSIFQDTLFIVSGDSLSFDVDTSGYLLDTLYLKNQPWQYGACKPIYLGKKPTKTTEFQYKSKPNIIIGKDTIRIVIDYVKAKVPNDTLCYLVIVKRANKTITAPITRVRAEKDTILCASTVALTGKLKNSILGACATQSIAAIKRKAYQYLDTCVYYKASRLGGTDNSTCLTLCDENQVCDNFIFPIAVLQDTITADKSEIFMDDFAYSSNYPNPILWLDDNVFVNNTMSLNPPSVGMATFDGLDYSGTPYGGGYGVSDVLTSAYLDFSTNKDVKYLSFYAEPKGLGFAPKKSIPLILEFKDNKNKWKVIKTIYPKANYSESEPSPGFAFYIAEIKDTMLYKGFQFRFRAEGNRIGMTDLWHLDYVRISKDKPGIEDKPSENGKPDGFNDLAYTRAPGSILKNYTAAPWKHIKGFEEKELKNSLELNIYSHFSAIQNTNNSDANITETKTGINLIKDYSYIPALNLAPQTFLNKEETLLQTQKDALLNNIKQIPSDITDLNFVKTLSFDVKKEQDKTYSAVGQNDKISSTTVCSNYFAYDDGVAESLVVLDGTESQLQVRFRTNVDDSLRAVMFHFPHYLKDITSFRFNLRVFIGALGKNPTYEKLFLRPDYPDKYVDILQGYTQYILTDDKGKPKALHIPKGDFYVGVQQVTTGKETFVVGFDKNNPTALANTFINFDGIWRQLTGSKGAIMVRPKLSAIASQVLANEEQTTTIAAEIYPNPAHDWLNVNIADAEYSDLSYTIFDLSGKAIQQGILTETIDTQMLANGFYIIKIQNKKGNKAYRQKISIIK